MKIGTGLLILCLSCLTGSASAAVLDVNNAVLSKNMASRQIDNIRKRLANLRLGVAGSSSIAQLQKEDLDLSEPILPQRGGEAAADGNSWAGVFANGQYGNTIHRGSINEDGFESEHRTLTAGSDYQVTDKFVAGVAFAGDGESMVIDRQGGGVDMAGYGMLAYLSYYLTNKSYIEAVWAAHRNKVNSTRQIAYTINNQAFSAIAYGDSRNELASVSVGIGHEAYFRRGFTVNVAANYDLLKTLFNPYAEIGAGDRDLVFDQRDNNFGIYSLSAQATYAIRFPGGVLIPQADVIWKHEFEDDPGSVRAYYRTDPNQSKFTLYTEAPDTDYFQVNLGANYLVAGGSLGSLYFEKTVGRKGYAIYNISLGIRVPL